MQLQQDIQFLLDSQIMSKKEKKEEKNDTKKIQKDIKVAFAKGFVKKLTIKKGLSTDYSIIEQSKQKFKQ